MLGSTDVRYTSTSFIERTLLLSCAASATDSKDRFCCPAFPQLQTYLCVLHVGHKALHLLSVRHAHLQLLHALAIFTRVSVAACYCDTCKCLGLHYLCVLHVGHKAFDPLHSVVLSAIRHVQHKSSAPAQCGSLAGAAKPAR